MDAEERAAAARAGAGAAREIAATSRDVHLAVLDRVRKGLLATGVGGSAAGAASLSAVSVATTSTYAAVRAGMHGTGVAVAEVLRRTTSPDASPLSQTPGGAATVAALDAAFGDHLSAGPATAALAPGLTLRRDGRPLDAGEAWSAHQGAGDSLWVFVHGLGGTEAQWSPRYLATVTDTGATPLLVRYNTGRSISSNGADLAGTLAAAVASWPVPPRRIVLVGHSMGGLVARSAVVQASGSTWVDAVTDVVTLGTPHTGAPLERTSHRALNLLHRWQVARPLAGLGHRRSAGIKDLRFGALLPEHWGDEHPDDVVDDPTWHVPLPEHVRHHAVIATIARDPGSLAARLVGDGLVPPDSAAGRAPADEAVEHILVPDAHHLSLLDHDDVVTLLGTLASAR